MPTILLAEDEHAIADTVLYALRSEGYAAEHVVLGGEVLPRLRRGGIDLVILDVGLPDRNGFDVCRDLRAESEVPVLFLTARDGEADHVLGLELGGDDYMAKPCSPRELSARLRAILRRTQVRSSVPDSVLVGELALYSSQRRIVWAGKDIPLTNAEFNLLELLIQNAGQVVSKSLLSEQGLGRPFQRYDRSIDVHLSSIRHKLPRLPDGRPRIQAVLRKGYQLLTD